MARPLREELFLRLPKGRASKKSIFLSHIRAVGGGGGVSQRLGDMSPINYKLEFLYARSLKNFLGSN